MISKIYPPRERGRNRTVDLVKAAAILFRHEEHLYCLRIMPLVSALVLILCLGAYVPLSRIPGVRRWLIWRPANTRFAAKTAFSTLGKPV